MGYANSDKRYEREYDDGERVLPCNIAILDRTEFAAIARYSARHELDVVVVERTDGERRTACDRLARRLENSSGGNPCLRPVGDRDVFVEGRVYEGYLSGKAARELPVDA